MAAKQLKNQIQHKLTVQPLAGDLVLTWDSVSGWPTVGDFPIRLDSVDGLTTEYVLATSVNVGANQTTVTRAQEGTSASGLFVINSTGSNVLSAQMLIDAMMRLDTALSQTLTGPLVIPTSLGGTAAPTSYGSMPIKLFDTLLAAPAASVSYTSIPQTFRHLKFDWYARGDTAAGSTSLTVRLNNDATANYEYEFQQTVGTVTTVPTEGLGQTGIFASYIPAATSTANYFAAGETEIKHYTGTVGNKLAVTAGGFSSGNTTGNQQLIVSCGKWRTVGVAVNRVDFLPAAGSLVTGSLITPWGEP